MIMKLLKPTLSKKIFILLIVSFCFINVLNVILDFDREKSHAYENLNDPYLNALATQLQNHYQNQYNSLDESFFKDINQTLKQREVDYKNIIILDNQMNMVYDQQSQTVPYLTLVDFPIEKGHYDYSHLIFELPSLDVSIKKELEKIINEQFHNETFPIKIASRTYEENKETNNGYVTDDICYLEIDNHIFFDQRQNNESIEELYFLNYESDNLYLTLTEFYPWNEIGYHKLSYDEMKQKVIKSIKEVLPMSNYDSFSFNSVFEEDGTLYSVNCLPLVKKGAFSNENVEYSLEDIQGYIIYYNYDFHAEDRIMNQAILSKIPTYVLSFVFSIGVCILLSYILTRRIKKINQSTLAIANNQFNIHLDEKSKDELGILSHNINQMSQQLDRTIQKLNQEIEHVKQLESVRKEFIANFTHEIKTPLGIINGYIELIEVIQDDDKKQDYLQAIEEEIKRINELVQAMLNLSRLESGYVEFNVQTIDLEDLITSTIESFAPLLEKKKIQIVLQGDFHSIQVDPFEFQIVIKNFISNAIKHTPHEGHIYISFNNNILSIENEGEYLTNEQKTRIWDTYVFGDREGTGLGLAICKTILDIHGFGYSVENTSRGVQFQIIVQ